jgi:hypothetical protein
MASNLYSEIRFDLRWVADYLEDTGLKYKVYNNGVLYNVTDDDGNVHSFYPTTGTIMLHDKDRRGFAVKLCNHSLYEFTDIVTNQKRVNQFINK